LDGRQTTREKSKKEKKSQCALSCTVVLTSEKRLGAGQLQVKKTKAITFALTRVIANI